MTRESNQKLGRLLAEESGQSLMIAALLFLVLLISIPAIFLVNRVSSGHGVKSQNRIRGRAVAEEGIAFAIQQLSQPGNWPITAAGWTPTPLPAGFLGGTTFTGAQGKAYTITCSQGPAPYQVRIVAVPLDSRGAVIPGSSIETIVSRHTVGVKLPTGLTASAALSLMRIPVTQPGSELRVEWGPMVCRDASPGPPWWTLTPMSDASQRPRKFAAGCLLPRMTGCVNPLPATTDQEEYWAFTSPGFASVINLKLPAANSYEAAAKNMTGVPQPVLLSNPLTLFPPTGCTSAGVPPSCGYFDVPAGETALFAGAVPGYAYAAANAVIYVKGDAMFRHVQMDLLDRGAFIVEGNLTLENNGNTPGGHATQTLAKPPTAALEDPHKTCLPGTACDDGITDSFIDLKGFLHVTGNLTTSLGVPPAANTYWTIYGVISVEGTLTLVPNTNLLLVYNDVVNHNIRTTTFELQADSTRFIP